MILDLGNYGGKRFLEARSMEGFFLGFIDIEREGNDKKIDIPQGVVMVSYATFDELEEQWPGLHPEKDYGWEF